MNIEKQAYTIPEFCEAYGIGPSKMYEEVAGGVLKIRKVGKRSLISKSDADAWLASLPQQQIQAAE